MFDLHVNDLSSTAENPAIWEWVRMSGFAGNEPSKYPFLLKRQRDSLEQGSVGVMTNLNTQAPNFLPC
jgi:hypothetical protein